MFDRNYKNVAIDISHFMDLLNKVDFNKDGKVSLAEVKLVIVILTRHIKEVLKCQKKP